MTLRAILIVVPLLVLAALWGCDNDTDNDFTGDPGGGSSDKTCLGCHSSEAELKEALGEAPMIAVANKDDG